MKPAIAILVAAVSLVATTSAPAATPLQRQVTTLRRQVTTLQRQVRTLQRQVRDARDFGIVSGQVAFCLGAITADALQNTWAVINQNEGRPIFGAPQIVNDRGICSALRVPRQPTQVPPTISPFSALFALLGASQVAPASFASPQSSWWR